MSLTKCLAAEAVPRGGCTMIIVHILCLYAVSCAVYGSPVETPGAPKSCQLQKQTNVVYRCPYRTAGDVFRSASSFSLTECDAEQPSGSVVYTMCRDEGATPSRDELMRCDDGVWNYEATC